MEILKGEINEKKYNSETHEMEITRIYHINYLNNIIYLESPMKVKILYRIKKALKDNNIKYKNIIIGRPDV